MVKTAKYDEEERHCENCKFNDGCKRDNYIDVCGEHKFEDECDELTEAEKESILGDVTYQRYKENDQGGKS